MTLLSKNVGLKTAALATILCLSAASVDASNHDGADEYQVKASLIFNFFKFTEWPKGSRENPNLSLCILGKDPFGRALEPFKGITIRNRKVSLNRPAVGASLKGCDAAYVSPSEATRLNEIVKAAENHGILTIADTAGFAKKGVMINMFAEGGAIRFEVNLAAASRSGIKLSSKLLKIARLAAAEEQEPK